MIKLISACAAVLASAASSAHLEAADGPVRFAIVGLTHDHASGFIPRLKGRQDVQLAGIVEPRADLVARYAKRFELDTNLFYPSLEALLARTNIQAVATFTSTFEHKRVVEACATRGIHVMMEEPVAGDNEQAGAIAAAANKGQIPGSAQYAKTCDPGQPAG